MILVSKEKKSFVSVFLITNSSRTNPFVTQATAFVHIVSLVLIRVYIIFKIKTSQPNKEIILLTKQMF